MDKKINVESQNAVSKFENKEYCKKVLQAIYSALVSSTDERDCVSMCFAYSMNDDDYAALLKYIEELRGADFIPSSRFEAEEAYFIKSQRLTYKHLSDSKRVSRVEKRHIEEMAKFLTKWNTLTHNLADLFNEAQQEDTIMHDFLDVDNNLYEFEFVGDGSELILRPEQPYQMCFCDLIKEIDND